MITLYHGDCLEQSDNIKDGSVDLILTDLPYGTINTKNPSKAWKKNGIYVSWDIAINPKKVYEIANRILRKNGKMVLFSQEPYTTELITNAIPNIPFNYRMIWVKDSFANCLLSKKAPVSYYEDVLVFSKNHTKHDFEGLHPLRVYFKDVLDFIGQSKKNIIEAIGQSCDHVLRINSSQFSLCTEKTYNQLMVVFDIDKMQGFRPYSELKEVDVKYRKNLLAEMNAKYPSTFNLWEGKKHKSNILTYKKDYSGYHSTQKPILLLEDLIKTFSNENDLVVDLTMGSGSTMVACKNTDRRGTGIEKEEKYYKIAQQRIKNIQKRLF